ncbi:hypothetical protein [Roseicella sp. DB1501]|uniref:hypothetical protein n=1 Tax=Roseicella sp. DB1501 TaxID=2730925 RepID=UPI001490D68C|nr:hypothetical protein [Roseicella sp. DB1501]NOG70466.1 hypothetical protein [Roseicella sp. DB1501]
MNWAAEQRQRFIDKCLAEKGQVNRSDLIEAFAISERQAASDFGGYIHQAPDNMSYDRERKAYVRGGKFRRVYSERDA